MAVTIEKEKFCTVAPLPGTGNATFYGWAFNGCKRVGSVWKFKNGYYVCNEDFDRNVHSRENRPKQFKGRTLKDLKADITTRL